MPNIIPPDYITKGYLSKYFEGNQEAEILGNIDNLIPENLIIEEQIENDGKVKILSLVDESKYVLSILRLVRSNICDSNYLAISKISSRVKKKGYATILYKYAAQYYNEPLISDRNLTLPGSYYIWDKLIHSQADGNHQVMFLDTNTCVMLGYINKKGKIFYWGIDQDELEVYLSEDGYLEYAIDNGVISSDYADYILIYKRKMKDKRHIRMVLSKK